MKFNFETLQISPIDDIVNNPTEEQRDELREMQAKIEDLTAFVVYFASNFEKLSALCISEILLYSSKKQFDSTVKVLKKFDYLISKLFSCVYRLCSNMLEREKEISEIEPCVEDCRSFTEEVSVLLDLLTSLIQARKYPSHSQDILHSVTSIAKILKSIIKFLSCNFFLIEFHHYDQGMRNIFDDLNLNYENMPLSNAFVLKKKLRNSDELLTAICKECNIVCEQECIRAFPFSWHVSCFNCHFCKKPCDQTTAILSSDGKPYCQKCSPQTRKDSSNEFSFVDEFAQLSFLISVGIDRLHGIFENRVDYRPGSFIQKPEVKTPMKTPVEQLRVETSSLEKSRELSISSSCKIVNVEDVVSRKSSFHSIAKEEGIQRRLSSRSKVGAETSTATVKDDCSVSQVNIPLIDESQKMFSDLTKLQSVIIRNHMLVLVSPVLEQFFTVNEIIGIMSGKEKKTIMEKIFKKKKDKKLKEGMELKKAFGADLDSLYESHSVPSHLSWGSRKPKIPLILQTIIDALWKSDLTVEGIFRLNGSIRQVHLLAEQLSQNPIMKFTPETNAIVLGALLKKYLRDMPDSLLTDRLSKLFLFVPSTWTFNSSAY